MDDVPPPEDCQGTDHQAPSEPQVTPAPEGGPELAVVLLPSEGHMLSRDLLCSAGRGCDL